LSRALIMLFTALPPAPPTPSTVMRGFSSGGGALKLMVMSNALLLTRHSKNLLANQPATPVRGGGASGGGLGSVLSAAVVAAEISSPRAVAHPGPLLAAGSPGN